MHQNRWRLGLRPRPRWGSLLHSQISSMWWAIVDSGMKFMSLLCCLNGLAVPQTLLEILYFRLQLSEIFCSWIIEQISENSDSHSTEFFLFNLKCTKIVGGWGSAPDLAGGAYSAPPDPLAVMSWDQDLMKLPGFSQHPLDRNHG